MADDDVDVITLLREPRPRSTLYLDVSHDSGASPERDHHRVKRIADSLAAAGAPAADVDELRDLLAAPVGVANPVSRFLVLDDGTPVVDEVLPGALAQPESVGFGTVLDPVPLLRHRRMLSAYMLVEAGRDGGRIRVYGSRGAAPLVSQETEGSTDAITKVRAGGWSNARYQNHTEEVWKHNETELAAEVDRLVRYHRPKLLILAGDVRALQLLQERLSPESKRILDTLPTSTRAAGASDKQLRARLADRLAELADAERRTVLDRLAAQEKRQGSGALLGVGPVVTALQQAQAETLVIDPDALGDHRLSALASEPWVTAAPEDAHGAEKLARVPAAAALVRAAMLTDADVVFAASSALPRGAAVAAVLRWPAGPGAPV